MTKLAQQFPVSVPRPVLAKGWGYKAQKAYARGRFDKLKPLRGQMVFNHRVEQIARAMAFDMFGDIQLHTTSPVLNNLHYGFELQLPVKIGKLTRKGAVLFPESNSALATLGLHGAAVLYWLGAMRVIDDLTGAKGEVIVNDGEFIYTSIGVLLQLAQDCERNPKLVLKTYMDSKHG